MDESELLNIAEHANIVNKFPVFSPCGKIHPVIFLKSFENFFPTRWSDSRKIQFVIGYLEAEAIEWAVLHRNDFYICHDFGRPM